MSNLDITKPVDLFQHAGGTGPVRRNRPLYVDFMPPCNSACPAGENIQAWMAFARNGQYKEAFNTIMEDNPFPAVMGRVCVRSCETGCNRKHIDTTVSIHAVERYIGDLAITENWAAEGMAPATGKKVLVVGGGPGGLSAAYFLARLGHTVELCEAGEALGGLMQQGVPAYRLPKNILNAEVKRITDMGITVRLKHEVTDVLAEKEAGGFDAVYLSIGAREIKTEQIENDGSVSVTTAFAFFKVAETGVSYANKKVVVYGGGKLAMYLARIVMRLGGEARVVFPGDRKLMPAYDYEADDAIEEGVQIDFLRRIDKISGNNLSLEVMKVEKNKAVGTGTFETIPADALILAIGQESGTGFLRSVPGVAIKEDGTVVIDASRMTGSPGIFAGGDMLPGENRSATIAIGHGKKAAKYIHGFLSGSAYQKPEKHPTAGYRKLHMWYKTEAPQKEQEKLAPGEAIKSFDEIAAGLSEKESRYEAQRCLSCGNCFECDGCFGACPEDAIIKLGAGKRYRFDYNLCTGCQVCYEQCPCHAIEMIPEPSNSTAHVNE